MFVRLVLLPTRVLVAAVIGIPIVLVTAFAGDGPYRWPIPVIAVAVLVGTIAVAWTGFVLSRRFLKWYLKPLKGIHDEGFNDAISGALGAIGVFYGVTVGLIAIDVWQRHSNAEDIVSREAAAIQVLYLMVKSDIGKEGDAKQVEVSDPSNKADAEKKTVPRKVSEYLREVVCVKWKEQYDGESPVKKQSEGKKDWERLKDIREKILEIEPVGEGQRIRYAATIQSLNHLTELRRLRGDAATDRLSAVMWMIIIVGAMMSMCVVYLFKLNRPKFHALLVCLLAAFLGLVLLMILLNDRPFIGKYGVSAISYRTIGWIVKEVDESAGKDWDNEICPRYLGSR